MPTLDNWLADSSAPDFSADRLIDRDPVTLLLARGATDIAAQTVRIVPASTARGSELLGSEGTQAGEVTVVVIGDSDLDIRRGDKFKHLGTTYEVETVDKTMPGKIEARARGVQR